MTTDFELFLRQSAPGVPDAGDVRRLNRREMGRALTSRGRRRSLARRAAVALASVAMVSMALVGELGSDNFAVTAEDASGVSRQVGVTRILKLGERGQAVPLLEGWSTEDAEEFANQAYLDEGRLTGITGWRTDSIEDWTMGFSCEVGGKKLTRARDPEGLPAVVDRRFIDFLLARGAAIADDPVGKLGPPARTEDIAIEGVTRTFRVWTFEDREEGTVTLYMWNADD